MLSSVDLPEPDGRRHDEFALIDVEVDVTQRMHFDLAHDIDLRQTARRTPRLPKCWMEAANLRV